MAVELVRRAGTEGCKTYWLDVRGRGGFLRVHTASITNPRQVDPELERLAAMVEAAPEAFELLRQALELMPLGTKKRAEWVGRASDLLCTVRQEAPAPSDAEELAQAKRVVFLPNGYSGEILPFYAEPVERDGALLKLKCAVPGKEYLVRWAREEEVNHG
ncbi:TPA: hypothetical protein ACHJ3C_004556 [Pseudomonas aeruginosa]|uniref:hypothetical protein n=1 Tax=Pseudomonas aeruginosa TaxID=287 RepID=UPI000940D186|nr:hypothetical protein [Pseudomonas aeruginosa]HDY6079983.1 hypothetical protein [Pseudomonas aeruginosa]